MTHCVHLHFVYIANVVIPVSSVAYFKLLFIYKLHITNYGKIFAYIHIHFRN